MNKEIDEIRRKLFEQVGDQVSTVFQGVVTAVNEEELTCTVRVDDAVDYFDVRLRGLVNAQLQGLALIPKMQSVVLVCPIGGSNELFVCQYTEIDKVIFTDNTLTLTIDTEKLELTREDVSITSDSSSTVIKAGDATITVNTDGVELKTGSSSITVTSGGLTLKKGGAGLKKTLEGILDAICQLTVPTGVGPSGVPINMAVFRQIKTEISQYMEG
ncbi:MAG: hypothetical protein J5952_03155 [Prevotella sp.]|nr:hypothetical protein [Prevotella sp.]